MTTSLRWTLAIHILAIISWMAGQLYLWRLYVNHAMETEAVVKDRLAGMERRLLRGIANPAMIVAFITGGIMLSDNWSYYSAQPWMWVKLTGVAGLAVWHGLAARYRKQLLEARCTRTHTYFRVMNEVPTLFMVVAVIMVIVRPWSR